MLKLNNGTLAKSLMDMYTYERLAYMRAYNLIVRTIVVILFTAKRFTSLMCQRYKLKNTQHSGYENVTDTH